MLGDTVEILVDTVEMLGDTVETDLEKTNSMNSVEFNFLKDFPPIC